MEMSESIADLATALAKAQAELEGAAKKSNNPAFRSKYADLGAVWDTWQEVGPKHGLSIVQFPTDMADAKFVGMTTMLMHTSGQWLRGVFSLPATKQDAHGFGSALTYLRRYSLAAVVGVCPVDDDGNAAIKPARAAPAAVAAPAAPAEKISKQQLDAMLLVFDNLPEGTVEKFCAAYNIAAVPDLPAAEYRDAMEKLAKRVAAQQQKVAA